MCDKLSSAKQVLPGGKAHWDHNNIIRRERLMNLGKIKLGEPVGLMPLKS